jgi:hypothetical protein
MIIYTKINSTRPPIIGHMVYYPHTKTIRTQVDTVDQFLLAGVIIVYYTGFGSNARYFVNNFHYTTSHLANSFLKYNEKFVYVIEKHGNK